MRPSPPRAGRSSPSASRGGRCAGVRSAWGRRTPRGPASRRTAALAGTPAGPRPVWRSPWRHCHSTRSLTAIDCHSLGIYTVVLLPLLPFSVEMKVSPRPVWSSARRRSGDRAAGDSGGCPRPTADLAAVRPHVRPPRLLTRTVLPLSRARSPSSLQEHPYRVRKWPCRMTDGPRMDAPPRRRRSARRAARLGFGRLAVSETETPSIVADLVMKRMRGRATRRCDRRVRPSPNESCTGLAQIVGQL
jgi:hypothetical protein